MSAIFALLLNFHCLVDENPIQLSPPPNPSSTQSSGAGTPVATPNLPADIVRDILRPAPTQFQFGTTASLALQVDVLDSAGQPTKAVLTLKDESGNVIYRGATNASGLLTDDIAIALAQGKTTMSIYVNGHETRQIDIANLGNLLKLDRTLYTPIPTTPVTDTDGDGIIDKLDDFPNDATRAFKANYPAKERYTVAFEDLYPNLGDYDMNDFVASYKIQEVRNAQNQIVEITGEVEAQARSAGYNHEFHLRIEGLGQAKAYISYEDEKAYILNTAEPESKNGVLDLVIFPKTKEAFVNKTVKQNGLPEVQRNFTLGYKTKFKILLSVPIASRAIVSPPYDPYIRVLNTNKNVHLPGKGAYESGNPSYLDSNNMPWGIIVPQNWEHPFEGKDIRQAYINFNVWRSSGGKEFPNWYDPSSHDWTKYTFRRKPNYNYEKHVTTYYPTKGLKITSEDGTVVLSIPPGALSEITTIEFAIYKTKLQIKGVLKYLFPAEELAKMKNVLRIVEVKPHGLNLIIPASLHIKPRMQDRIVLPLLKSPHGAVPYFLNHCNINKDLQPTGCHLNLHKEDIGDLRNFHEIKLNTFVAAAEYTTYVPPSSSLLVYQNSESKSGNIYDININPTPEII